MNTNLAETITKQASTQTYYTIRFLVDQSLPGLHKLSRNPA